MYQVSTWQMHRESIYLPGITWFQYYQGDSRCRLGPLLTGSHVQAPVLPPGRRVASLSASAAAAASEDALAQSR
jgi:hypothetical protein